MKMRNKIEYMKNMEDNAENDILSTEENMREENTDNFNNNENTKKSKDAMNNNENIKNMLYMVYHESCKLIYEDTNIHVEIPSIIYNDNNNNNKNDEINNVRKIDYLKDYLNNNMKHLNLKNKETFLKNINVITEILNYNFKSIYKNKFKFDTVYFHFHDYFLSHILKMKKKLENDKIIEEKSANNESKNNEKNFKSCKKDAFFFNANIGKHNFNFDYIDKMELLRDQQKIYDEKKQNNKFPKENIKIKKNLLKELNEQVKATNKNGSFIYEKMKNIYCIFEPGNNYKYIYPPNHKIENIKEFYIPKENILFNSKFESANLQYAMKEKNKEIYSLFLNHDIRISEKKNQWFYFSASYVPDEYYNKEMDIKKNKQRNMNEFLNEINKDIYLDCDHIKYSVDSADKFSVSNVKKLEKPFTVRFKIANMSKPYFLYKEGYSPLVFSECKNKFENIHWERNAYDIKYIKNTSSKYFNIKKKCFENLSYNTYSLEFSYDFTYSYDTVYFCSCYPYTYSYLTQYLNYIKNYLRNNKTINYIVEKLCKTTCGFDCPIIALTNYDNITNSKERASKENQKSLEKIGDVINGKIGDKFEEKINCNNEPGNTLKNKKFIFNHENIKEKKINNLQNDDFCIKNYTNLEDKENEEFNKHNVLIKKENTFPYNEFNNIKNTELYITSELNDLNNNNKVNNLYAKENKENDHNYNGDDKNNNNNKLCYYNLCHHLSEKGLFMSERDNKENINRNIKSNSFDSFLNNISTKKIVNKSSNMFMNEFSSLLKKDNTYELKKIKIKHY